MLKNLSYILPGFHRNDPVLSYLARSATTLEGAAAMWKKFKQTWRRLKAGNPGQRFQQEFRRRRGAGRSRIQKALLIVGGVLLMAAGFLLLFIPGPGLVLLFAGGFMIAQQSLVAARALDWSEIRLRKLLAWSLCAWRRSSTILQVLVVVVAVVVLGAVGLGVFKLLDYSSGI
jgi:Putative transmembrane protein (PGPGW)